MSIANNSLRPVLGRLRPPRTSLYTCYNFGTSAARSEEATLQSTSSPPPPPPPFISTPRQERQLLRSGVQLVGSRRRRAAQAHANNIPFEQLPYQCFQEARKILQADREEKLRQIEVERQRIARAEALDPAQCGGEASKKGKLVAMRKYLDELKILADINDPMIKKRFEDGDGDMNRPIYRYLADRKWRRYERKVLLQRIMQMNIVPDVLPHLDPTADVALAFGRKEVQPGEFVESQISARPPQLNVQVFEKGEKLVSIAVIDSDVPNIETDHFDYRCHFLAVNVPISPVKPRVSLSQLSQETQVALPWLPPYAQKGSPYHRLSIFVLEQPEGRVLDVEKIREREQRPKFNLRSFNDKHIVKPIGVHLFRNIWDDDTAEVMRKAGIEGANIELKRKKPESLPYKKKNSERYR